MVDVLERRGRRGGGGDGRAKRVGRDGKVIDKRVATRTPCLAPMDFLWRGKQGDGRGWTVRKKE